MHVKNVLAELAAHPDGTFIDVAPFNGASIGACDITGISTVWEMHPDTDEFFYVIQGELEVTLLLDTGREPFVAGAGSTLVVPRGVWHKPGAPKGAKFIYLTPGQTLHSEADDPRAGTD